MLQHNTMSIMKHLILEITVKHYVSTKARVATSWKCTVFLLSLNFVYKLLKISEVSHASPDRIVKLLSLIISTKRLGT